MKFTVERGALAAAVKLARIAVPTKPTTSIITTHVRLTASPNGGLLVEGTDTKVFAAAECPAVVDAAGVATAPAHLLAAMLAQCNAPRLAVTLDKGKLRLAGAGTRLALPMLDPVDFPDFAQRGEPTPLAECDAAEFRRAVSAVAHAAAEDESRPNLACIYLEFGDDSLRLSAADGFRCAAATFAVSRPGGDDREVALINADALKKLADALPDGQLAVARHGNAVTLATATCRAASLVMDLGFPDLRQIMDGEVSMEARMPRQALRDAARLVAVASEENATGGLKGRKSLAIEVAFGPDGCAVRTAGDSEADLAVPLLSPPPAMTSVVKLDAGYLADALGALGGDEVAWRVTGSYNHNIIADAGAAGRGWGAGESIHDIMPIHRGAA